MERRLRAVEDRIAGACRRAGRRREEVTLVVVTKTVGPEVAGWLHALGVRDLGESRPQELWRKRAVLPPDVRWNLIGHVQRNKIERTLPVHLIHSVDSLRLLEALNEHGTRVRTPVRVLLQVNVSREGAKQGFPVAEMPAVATRLADFGALRVAGLMTMAPLESDPERCRPVFAGLRELRDRLRPAMPSPHNLKELSMGMSNDFEVAIEEGATLVRLGSVILT